MVLEVEMYYNSCDKQSEQWTAGKTDTEMPLSFKGTGIYWVNVLDWENWGEIK